MSKSTKQKTFVKKDKIKFMIELKKGSDGTFGINFYKNMKLKIIPGKSLPKGLEKDDKLISIDGIPITTKEVYERVKRTHLTWTRTEADFVFTRFKKQRYALKKRSLPKISEVNSSEEKSSSLSNKSKSKSKSKSSSSDKGCVGLFCKYPSRKGRKKTKKRKKK
tara:strand:- start:585 stop:1076 length:492 start_codon:yes stop_codon:yes gene_type:complete